MTEPRVLASAEELTELAELNDVIYLSLGGVRHDEVEVDEPIQPDIQLRAGWSDDATQFVVHAELSVKLASADLTAEVQVQYRLSEPATADELIVGEFLGRSAVLVAAPYLREAVTSLAARLRVPVPNFPLIRPSVLEPLEIRSDVDDESVSESGEKEQRP